MLDNYEKDSNSDVFPRSRSIKDYCDKIEYYASKPAERLKLVQVQQMELKKLHNPRLIGETIHQCYNDILNQHEAIH